MAEGAALYKEDIGIAEFWIVNRGEKLCLNAEI